MQEVIVYIVIAVAVLATILLLWRQWHRPTQSGQCHGCADCPFADRCTRP